MTDNSNDMNSIHRELGRITSLLEGVGKRMDNNEVRQMESERAASDARARVYEKIELISHKTQVLEVAVATLGEQMKVNEVEVKSWRVETEERLKRLEANDTDHTHGLEAHQARLDKVEPEADFVKSWRQRWIGVGIAVTALSVLLGTTVTGILKKAFDYFNTGS